MDFYVAMSCICSKDDASYGQADDKNSREGENCVVGKRGSKARPIELHAHDPIRYLGDMLAWVHQAIAAECEFLESLFGLGGQEDEGRARRMVGAVRTFEGSEEEGGEQLGRRR